MRLQASGAFRHTRFDNIFSIQPDKANLERKIFQIKPGG